MSEMPPEIVERAAKALHEFGPLRGEVGDPPCDECREDAETVLAAAAAASLGTVRVSVEEFEAGRAAVRAVERVRALHQPMSGVGGMAHLCAGCYAQVAARRWPCPTIAALDGPSSVA